MANRRGRECADGLRLIAVRLMEGAAELAQGGLLVDKTIKTPREAEGGKAGKAGEVAERISLADQLVEIRRIYEFLGEESEDEGERRAGKMPPWLIQRALWAYESSSINHSPAKPDSMENCEAGTRDSQDQ